MTDKPMYAIRIRDYDRTFWVVQDLPSVKGNQTMNLEVGEPVILRDFDDDGTFVDYEYTNVGNGNVKERRLVEFGSKEHQEFIDEYQEYFAREHDEDDFIEFTEYLSWVHGVRIKRMVNNMTKKFEELHDKLSALVVVQRQQQKELGHTQDMIDDILMEMEADAVKQMKAIIET